MCLCLCLSKVCHNKARKDNNDILSGASQAELLHTSGILGKREEMGWRRRCPLTPLSLSMFVSVCGRLCASSIIHHFTSRVRLSLHFFVHPLNVNVCVTVCGTVLGRVQK